MVFVQLAFLDIFIPGALQGYRVSPEVKEALLLNLVDALCCPLLALVGCLVGEMREEVG